MKGKEIKMEIKKKILDADTNRIKWKNALEDHTVLRKNRKEAAMKVEFFEGRFDILMDILHEGTDILTQKIIKIKLYEIENKIKTWNNTISNPKLLSNSGKTAAQATGLIKYFEGQQSALHDIEKEL